MARILFVASSGPQDPTRASIPFHLAANGAAEAGIESGVVLAGDASVLVKSSVAQEVAGVGLPPLPALLDKARQKGIPLYV